MYHIIIFMNEFTGVRQIGHIFSCAGFLESATALVHFSQVFAWPQGTKENVPFLGAKQITHSFFPSARFPSLASKVFPKSRSIGDWYQKISAVDSPEVAWNTWNFFPKWRGTPAYGHWKILRNSLLLLAPSSGSKILPPLWVNLEFW